MRIQLMCVLAVTAGCIGGGGDDGDDDGGSSASCMEATQHDDLAWIETNIFTRSCVFSACHDGSPDAAGLDLRAGKSYAELVDRPSTVTAGETLVVPGDPQASYLLVVLGQYPGALPEEGTMPLGSPVLCREKRDAIERWIAAGALP